MIHWILLWGINSSTDVLCCWQRSEWIYRGSTRLEPLYTALVRSHLRVSWYTESYSEVVTLVQMYFVMLTNGVSGSSLEDQLDRTTLLCFGKQSHILRVSWYTESYSEVLTLVQMYFAADKRSEWIYRGSTRLEPLYTAFVRSHLRVSWYTVLWVLSLVQMYFVIWQSRSEWIYRGSSIDPLTPFVSSKVHLY